jgi:glyoxylase-like metal-dependent hydrolase (beta-lactamase superfamily II)
MAKQTFSEVAPNLYCWTNVCNSYVLRDGETALLFDVGDGSVLDALGEIGVKQVDWALFTHHHREQCQGAAKLSAWRKRGTRVGAPELEREFFERPEIWRKMRPTLNDKHTVYGASYVRPSVKPIAIDRGFAKMDSFTWRQREIWCIDTAGHSPGHMAFMFRDADGGWLGVSGGLMLDGARLCTWFDSEWDYGFGAGIYASANSAAQVAGYDPKLLLPAHGPVIKNAKPQLLGFIEKLKALEAVYLRGYSSKRFANCDQDTTSRPTAVPHVWQVTPHLYKFRGPDYWVNFAIIISDSGRGLVVDCGLFDRAFLSTAIKGMSERLGLKGIDVAFITHMHGDHALDAAYLRRQHGAKLWTMEGVADKFERPWDFDLSALLPFYTDRKRDDIFDPLHFDRVLKDGEKFTWEGYKFTVDWMPGQTKFHVCLHVQLDGRRVAFCGDNIFASTTDPNQGGNECVLARNGGALEEGYLYAASYLHALNPDLIIGGHCWALDKPKELIERYRKRMIALRDAFQNLSAEPDYRIMFDPYWVRAEPYRVVVKRGGTATAKLELHSYWPEATAFRLAFHAPDGIAVEPGASEARVAPGQRSTVSFKVSAGADTREGVHMVAIDTTVGVQRFGERFDFVVYVGEPPPAKPAS